MVGAIAFISLAWMLTFPPWQVTDGSITQITLSQIGSIQILDLTLYPSKDAPNVPDILQILRPVPTPINFAFIGAYFFSIQMLFHRFLSRDLRASIFVTVLNRIILVSIGTWIVTTLISGDPYAFIQSGKEEYNYLGFVIGVFPSVIFEIIKKYTYGEYFAYFEEKMPLNRLDGVDIWTELRLKDENINSIQDMATVTIIDLMLKTRIPPNRIIYWIDQAILYTTIGLEQDKRSFNLLLNELSNVGIKTATSLIDNENKIKSYLEKSKIKISQDEIELIVAAIKNNSNIKLIQHWNKSTP